MSNTYNPATILAATIIATPAITLLREDQDINADFRNIDAIALLSGLGYLLDFAASGEYTIDTKPPEILLRLGVIAPSISGQVYILTPVGKLAAQMVNDYIHANQDSAFKNLQTLKKLLVS